MGYCCELLLQCCFIVVYGCVLLCIAVNCCELLFVVVYCCALFLYCCYIVVYCCVLLCIVVYCCKLLCIVVYCNPTQPTKLYERNLSCHYLQVKQGVQLPLENLG